MERGFDGTVSLAVQIHRVTSLHSSTLSKIKLRRSNMVVDIANPCVCAA